MYIGTMTFFRSHIISLTVLLLFVMGITIIAWPAEERIHSGESISSWLLELRSDTDNPLVISKIDSLKTENGDIPALLRKASAIVGAHQDDFTIPVDASGASDDDIYNTLLIKWTLHQQNKVADTVMITDRQSKMPQVNENDDKTIWNQFTHSIQFVIGTYSKISEAWEYIRMLLRPLASGIAINAP